MSTVLALLIIHWYWCFYTGSALNMLVLISIYALTFCFPAYCTPDACPTKYEPICGTDGNTYPNRCQLGKEACTNNDELRAAYIGACIEPTSEYKIQIRHTALLRHVSHRTLYGIVPHFFSN